MAAPMNVELGFLLKTDPWKLKSKYFPCKIGGKPAWLNLRDLPCGAEIQCEICNKPLTFLLQIYAPVIEQEECFHRTLFLFFCKDPGCSVPNEARNFIAFRCQLPRKNEFYSYEPPIENRDDTKPTSSDFVSLCFVCGAKGGKKCANCNTPYCSKEHQILDWKAGHKEACKSRSSCTAESNAHKHIPEYEIVTEGEHEQKGDNRTDEENENYLEHGLDSKDLQDLEEMAASRSDKQFSKFRKRIALDPEQVLRYQRSGVPLWVSSTAMPNDGNVPNCDNCGATRQFEFQVLPQLLNHLKLDDVETSVDWGTVVVYTCSKNCSTNAKAYLKEFVYKQDFSQANNCVL